MAEIACNVQYHAEPLRCSVLHVDNRLIIASTSDMHSLVLHTLISPYFYGSPIELEDVGYDHSLGLNEREVHFIPILINHDN